MAKEWNEHCNMKAYGQDGGFSDNREEVAFKSGRKIFYAKNSAEKKTHALNFCFDDKKKVDGKTEFEWFLFWCETTLRCRTESFLFPDIITHNTTREYRLAEGPAWSGLGKKEVSVKFEEA